MMMNDVLGTRYWCHFNMSQLDTNGHNAQSFNQTVKFCCICKLVLSWNYPRLEPATCRSSKLRNRRHLQRIAYLSSDLTSKLYYPMFHPRYACGQTNRQKTDGVITVGLLGNRAGDEVIRTADCRRLHGWREDKADAATDAIRDWRIARATLARALASHYSLVHIARTELNRTHDIQT